MDRADIERLPYQLGDFSMLNPLENKKITVFAITQPSIGMTLIDPAEVGV